MRTRSASSASPAAATAASANAPSRWWSSAESSSVRAPGPAAATNASTPSGVRAASRRCALNGAEPGGDGGQRGAQELGAGDRDRVGLGRERAQRREPAGGPDRAAGERDLDATVAAARGGRRSRAVEATGCSASSSQARQACRTRCACAAGQLSVPATSHGSGTTSPSSERVAARNAPRRRRWAAEDMTPR